MHPICSRFLPLAILAVTGLAAAGWSAYATVRPTVVPALDAMPLQGPWPERISASGLIEGDGNDTIIGVPEAALVSEVAVRIGQRVAAGDLLFRLDDRLVRADLTVAEAEVAIAQADAATAVAEISRLDSLPRSEDAIPAAAQVAVAEAQLRLARTRRVRLENLGDRGIDSEREDARLAEAVAKAEVGSAEAALAHISLPAWSQDLELARRRQAIALARIAAAQARADAVRVRLSRLAVRSPRAATVIASEVMVGSLATPGDRNLVVLADLDRLMVRIEIDESQAWKLQPGLPGQGWLRGARTRPVELRYERIEPRAAARRAILGKPGERLDGRAVQALYHLVDPPVHLRPGLLMEIDLAAAHKPER
ncbi:MAG: efflux RND transporter periplasmic adaptor subunit [Planctomycetes bacterium]|nr:efflux RND transporter periplasmic adaptor subunit [Planctomycetota bacterium]